MRVLIDGIPFDDREAAISVFDHGLLRGDGCFEALRSYGGRPFAVDEHLDRLHNSAQLLGIELPSRTALASWIAAVATDGGDCTVRIVVTRGGLEPFTPSRVIVLWEPIPDMPDVYSVLPVAAPWHPGGSKSELTGAKTLSYAQNMAAGRAAREAGFDDALLIGASGDVLEGPTYSVVWVTDSVMETPSLDLGILSSITRQKVLQEATRAGIAVREGHFDLSRIQQADEVMVLSSVKEVRPVGRVGEWRFTPGPITGTLAERYRRLVALLSAAD